MYLLLYTTVKLLFNIKLRYSDMNLTIIVIKLIAFINLFILFVQSWGPYSL